MELGRHKKPLALPFLVTFFIIACFHSCGKVSDDSKPVEGWQTSTPENQGIQSQKLAEMMESIQRNSYNIDSIIIVRNGQMVFEAYFYPYKKGLTHVVHSCTKSVMSALIGIALDKGYLKDVDQPVMDFFPQAAFANMDDHKKSMTLKDLLVMASGLKCRDSYRYQWQGLFEMRNSSNWAQYVLDLPMETPPGTKFEYCNGTSYLLSVILQNATNTRTLQFAKEHFFHPLGIADIDWAACPQGVDIGYGDMWLKPEDMAKIGQLYLNKGRWNDSQILPASWVEESTRGHIDATLFDQYGYQWWVDSAGFYTAVGYKGQFIFVVPETNMVVVFTSDLQGYDFYIPKRMLENYIIPAAASTEALPPDKDAQARLAELASSVAAVREFSWTAQQAGVANDGVYVRKQSPRFTFTYPQGSKKEVINSPDQVMRMRTPGNVHFSASVVDIPQGLKLEDFGPAGYAPRLEEVGSNVKVISNKEITLKCGTKAFRTDIKWTWRNTLPITTFVVSTYKDGKCIFVCAHPWKNHFRAEPIVTSLSFE